MNLYPQLKTILLDMDGVLWRGSDPVLDIKRLFAAIQGLGFQVYCVTNNSTRTVNAYLDILNRFEVSLDPAQIITSAEATAAFLESHLPQGGSMYVIGEEGIKLSLQNKGFQILNPDTGKNPQAVVVGLDRNFKYQDLAIAVRYINQGALFVGTNPDLTIPTPAGLAPGAGTIIKAIEISSGEIPHIIGKPFSPLYSLALERSHSLPEETMMIGDRLETDILGAQKLGLLTALVLTGITGREQAETWEPGVDIIAEDALQAIEIIKDNHGKSL